MPVACDRPKSQSPYKDRFMPSTSQRLIILVAGPYRSGTNGDLVKMAANLHALEEHALAVYRLGRLPMIGEWVALPLSRAAGSKEIGDAISEEYLYPVAGRLLDRCDAVLRIPGQSKGADQDVRIAKERGLQIFPGLEKIPKVW
jgi:hypothetical protein